MNSWFEKECDGIAQIFKIRRTIMQGEEVREGIIYNFTSLNRKKASAKRILQLNQKHWAIENRLHYQRDMTLDEDASQVRKKGGG